MSKQNSRKYIKQKIMIKKSYVNMNRIDDRIKEIDQSTTKVDIIKG